MSNPSDFHVKNGVLTNYTGSDGDVIIPDGVTSIRSKAFFQCSRLKSVTIQEGVTKIGDWAFIECKGLKRVMIPHSLTSIGNEACEGCSSLTSLTLPQNVSSIGNRAFASCNKLSSFVIENPDCVLEKDVFGSKLPKGLIDHIGNLYQHMTDPALKQYVIPKLWNQLDTGVQAGIFANRQSKTLLTSYQKSITEEQVEPLGEALLDIIISDPSPNICSSVASFMKLFCAKASVSLLQKLFEQIKNAKNGAKARKALETIPELMDLLNGVEKELSPVDQSIKDILSKKHISASELELVTADYYGLKAKDLPKLQKLNGTVADPVVLMYLLTAHETTKVYKSGKQNVVNAFEAPGLSPEAAEIVSLLSVESLQAAIRELGNLMLTAEARGKKTVSCLSRMPLCG